MGLDQINQTFRRLGLINTQITNDVRDMLDAIVRAVGFANYQALAAHDPQITGPTSEEIQRTLVACAPLDPTRGSRTTAAETVALFRAIWTDQAGPPAACAAVRRAMARQLTRHRIASAFGPTVAVAAKSGGLLGIVRNEAGVVTFPDNRQYAVAVFTRARPHGVQTQASSTQRSAGSPAC